MQLLLFDLDIYVVFLFIHAAAGKTLCNGGTPGPGLHNQMHNAQGLLLTLFSNYDEPNDFLEVSYAAC